MGKKFDPKKTVTSVVAKLRKGALAAQLKNISDEDLFSLMLTGYEAGVNDACDALNPHMVNARSRSTKVEARIVALEAIARANTTAANQPKQDPNPAS